VSLNEKEYLQLKVGAREHALNFSWDKTVDGLIEVYERALIVKPKLVRNLKAI
jgi:hypothetical protein